MDNKMGIVSNYCSLYTICDKGNEQLALNKAIESNQKDIELYTKYVKEYPGDYWEERLETALKTTYSIMTFEEYLNYQKDFYLQGDPAEITEERFEEMLSVLPPMKWCTINGVEQFLISEFYTNTFTNQYARKGDKYYTKMVDAADKSTWLHNIL